MWKRKRYWRTCVYNINEIGVYARVNLLFFYIEHCWNNFWFLHLLGILKNCDGYIWQLLLWSSRTTTFLTHSFFQMSPVRVKHYEHVNMAVSGCSNKGWTATCICGGSLTQLWKIYLSWIFPELWFFSPYHTCAMSTSVFFSDLIELLLFYIFLLQVSLMRVKHYEHVNMSARMF